MPLSSAGKALSMKVVLARLSWNATKLPTG
jgi:hypothetical protein